MTYFWNSKHVQRYCSTAVLLATVASTTLASDDNRHAALSTNLDPAIASQLSTHQKELWREFKRDYAELVDYYENARIDATRTLVGMLALKNADNPEGKAIRRFTYRARDNTYFRLDSEKLTLDTEEPTGVFGVTLIRPEGFVSAHKSGSADSYIVEDWGSDRLKGFNVVWHAHFADAPLTVGTKMSDVYMLQRPPNATTYRIVSVEELEEAGRQCVNVSIKSASASGSTRADAVFLRDGKWAVKRFRMDHSTPSGDDHYVDLAEFEYEGDPGEFPLLKSGRYWVEAPEPESKNWQETFRIDRIQPGAVALEEFSLASIGLHVGQHRANWTMRLAAVGVGVLLVACYFIWRKRKA